MYLLATLPLDNFAGEICEGAGCAPLSIFVILFFYGHFILAFILLIIVLQTLNKNRNRSGLKKAGLILLIAILVVGVRQYSFYKNDRRFVKQYKEYAKQLEFQVYEPSYFPEGQGTPRGSIGIFKPRPVNAASVAAHDVPSGSGFPYVFMNYGRFHINQFDINKIDNGKAGGCGPNIPESASLDLYTKGDDRVNCTYVKQTSNGFMVYKGLFNTYYATKGKTRVSFEEYKNESEMLDVIEGLRPVAASDLKFINRDY